jgi:signal transduction histidine kinase
MTLRKNLSFTSGLTAIAVAGVLMVVLVCQPTAKDAPVFALLMATPLLVALVLAFVSQRAGLLRRFRHIGAALFLVYALGAGLVLLTMLLTTNLMFISAHDAEVAGVIVLYATGVTLVFGNFVTQSLTDGISRLTFAAQAIERGVLDTRADDRGNDELARLATTFNRMTGQLARARDLERQTEQTRREWIAGVSHDLRTPLTSLRARTEALVDGVITEPAEVSSYLTGIRNDAEALSRLIDDLGELARIDAGGLRLDKTPVNLNDLVSDTIEGLGILARERGIALRGEYAADLPRISVSPQHIQRVLNNLAGNALAHTQHGSITIRTHALPGAGVRVEVRDTGEGIPAADLPHVFDRFFRGERSRSRNGRSGMGLGLPLTQALVRAHDGQIGIESQPGQGTTVWFTLP